MTKKNDQERLLDDVLAGEADAGFHEALLAETLRLVRNRRRAHRAQRVGGLLAAVSVIIMVALWRIPRAPVRVQPPRAQNYELALSQPFPATSIVLTRPLAANQLVASKTPASVVQTAALSGSYREVGDDELLALAAPQLAALVRRGPHTAELVFLPAPAEAIPDQN